MFDAALFLLNILKANDYVHIRLLNLYVLQYDLRQKNVYLILLLSVIIAINSQKYHEVPKTKARNIPAV